MSHNIDYEPSSYEEEAYQQVWKDVMTQEYQSIMKNDVWEIVMRPEGKSMVTSKWIYKIKNATDGSIDKYKVRFLARGFSQKQGVDYEETFTPISRYTSIKTIISLASVMGCILHHMDVKSAFLNRVIEEEFFIEKTQCFVIHWKESHVFILKKALYGLKHAPRAWYFKIDGYLMILGFTKIYWDPSLYYNYFDGDPLILVLYVDNKFLTRVERLIVGCKS
jgi:hypothetical protein